MTMRIRNHLLSAAIPLATALFAAEAVAQDHSWTWPLYVNASTGMTGEPRPAIWGGNGEYQSFSTTYMHPGNDFRGSLGDPAIVPVNSSVLRTFAFQDDCVDAVAASCRAWFQAEDAGGRYLWYVSHIYIGQTPQPGNLDVNTEVRQALLDAGDPSATVSRGEQLAVLGNFTGWHHLHLGVFDTQNNYALLHTPDFLEQTPVGDTMESLLIVDDEAPVIVGLDLVNNGSSISGGSAVVGGACGDEVSGNLDIVAEAFDTFYTQGPFATFTNKSTLNPDTNLKSAHYSILELSTGTVVAQGTWFDHAATPLVCGSSDAANCIVAGTNPDINAFLDRMGTDATSAGAPDAGLQFITTLYDPASASDFRTANGERYFHTLTNAGGTEGSWNTAGLANGRYQITMEAFDFAGRGAAKSRFVYVRQPGTTLDPTQPGFADVYLRDRLGDTGAVPSNAGGEPWWESPDIFIVPAGTPVDINSGAVQTLVTANTPYDVYVRVHNDSCQAISDVRVQVLSADPSAINAVFTAITPDGMWVGDPDNPAHDDVAAGGAALIGPFGWMPTPAEASGDGHRCLIASITAAADALDPANRFDAPAFNNVTQRNLRVDSCNFQVTNATSSDGALVLRVVTDAAVESNDVVELRMPFLQAAFDAWDGTLGATLVQEGTDLIVRMGLRDLTLPEFQLPAGVTLTVNLSLSLTGSASRFVRLEPTFNGMPEAGFSCLGQGVSVPR
jgi:hypothetical protein